NIDGAKQDEQRRQRRARTKKPFAALSRFADQPGTKAVSDRHHYNPWHQRITRSEAITPGRNDDPAAVQNLPEPAEFPECSRLNVIEQVMTGDHHQAKRRDPSQRQEDESRQPDHRPADGPDHDAHRKMVIKMEQPAAATTPGQ